MTTKTIFAALTRAVGLCIILYGASTLFDCLLIGIEFVPAHPDGAGLRYQFVRAFVEIAVGAVLMRGLLPMADWAFPAESQKKDDDTVA